mgnify:CR=1 FL=1
MIKSRNNVKSLSEVKIESGSSDRAVASRFGFRRNLKAVARFQSELSFRILQEIHRNKGTPFGSGGDSNLD